MSTTSGNHIKFSASDVKRIKSVQFGLMNPEDIKKFSVCEVSNKETFNLLTGRPNDGGVNDLRMGTTDKAYKCATCNCSFEECVGHFGHIELGVPVYHIGFVEECYRILQCVCSTCGRLLLNSREKYDEVCAIKNKKQRRNKIYSMCKDVRKCEFEEKKEAGEQHLATEGTELGTTDAAPGREGCGNRKFKFRRSEPLVITAMKEWNDEDGDEEEDIPESQERNYYNYPASECLELFNKIPKEDCLLLGFDCVHTHPSWMLIQSLLVAPPPCRPSVAVNSSLRSQDDLTNIYKKIVDFNWEIKKQLNDNQIVTAMEDNIKHLQFYVATLMKNEMQDKAMTKNNQRPIKSISARLKGKEGRLRGNLMGKRVDFSARSVISPDPNLEVDELGVPQTIARNLTFPEVVNKLNIERLKQLVANGPDCWPGAKMLILSDGTRKDLKYVKNRTDLHLSYGDVVERHTCDGDYVIFNRQPSLHKMSMMGHRVRVLPYSTFRLNLSVTTPYNADFDGDEMNMHVPQSWETRSEIMNIMHVPKQIVSPQGNRPVMGIVQDTLIGVMLFTKRDNFITLDQMMNLVLWIKDFDGNLPVPAVLKPQPLWTGKQLFSLIIPKISLVKRRSNDKLNERLNLLDDIVEIASGDLIQGIICKKTVGNTSGGLIHLIWNEVGPDRTIEFLTNCQKLVNNWLLLNGWTVGISDIISDDATNEDVKQQIQISKENVQKNLIKAQIGELTRQAGKSMIDFFELEANDNLNKAISKSGELVQKSLKPSNHLKNMVSAGSKGNLTNISQIIACVGQQNVEGKRIPFNFGGRTLPHFVKDDYGPESKGFVQNSYLSGLSPQEFYFHAMAGREGIIDTAIKTSKTGYIQRRLVKSLEDVMVQYDRTVRNSSGNVIQFLYGEDGMAGEYIEDLTLDIIEMDDEKLRKKFKFFEDREYTLGNLKTELRRDEQDRLHQRLKKFMAEEEVNKFIYSETFQASLIELEKEFEDIKRHRDELRADKIYDKNEQIHIPVNIKRIIANTKSSLKIEGSSKSNLNPLVVLSKVKELKEQLEITEATDEIAREAQKNALKVFKMIIDINLCTKQVIQVERFSQAALDSVLGQIRTKFLEVLVQPGEMVGSIAAQSIGEPATQMTLNTFHFAGVSKQNVTLGVPRLEEVINVARTLKTPTMTIYLDQEYFEKEVQKMSDAKIRDSALSDEEKDKAVKLNRLKLILNYKSKIEYTLMRDIVNLTEIYYDPDVKNTIIEKDKDFLLFTSQFYEEEIAKNASNLSPWVLRVELDPKKVDDIVFDMEKMDGLIHRNFTNVLALTRPFGSGDDNKKVLLRIEYDARNPAINREEVLSEFSTQQFESIFLNVPVCGIPNVTRVYLQDEKKVEFDAATGRRVDKVLNPYTKKLEDNLESIITTDGANLAEIFQIEGIDFRRSFSNDVNEIFGVLGIEAARKSLIKEVRNVLGVYGIYVNYRHIAILCDTMTQRGFLTSITRHGLSKSEHSPIRRCSFEQTVDVLLESGSYGEKDHIKGVSENILLGQMAKLGTGCLDIFIDREKIKAAKSDSMDIEAEELLLIDSVSNKDSTTPSTPYIGTTYNFNKAAGSCYFTPCDGRNVNFTPGVGQSPCASALVGSTYKNESNFISTPNPGSIAPNSPVYNPYVAQSPGVKTPGPYSPPMAGEGMNSAYASVYSPTKSPGQGASVYTTNYNKRYGDVATPNRSSYSPTTPGLQRSSSGSPQYFQGSAIYSGSPGIAEGSNSGYRPDSPNYNPTNPVISPAYGYSQSVYSKASPYIQPRIKEENNEDEDDKEEKDIKSPKSRDDDDDD